MVSFAHVLVPTDGSALAARAVPVARAVADRLGARTAVVSVAAAEAEMVAHERHVAELAAELDAPADARWVVMEATAAKGIALVASDLGDTLVCMSSHGHGRSAALVGSVAQDLLVGLRAPLLLVGPSAGPAGAHDPVVVTVDGTPGSEAAIEVAAEWAAALDVDLRVVTVAEPVPEPMDGHSTRRAHGPDGDVDAYLSGLLQRVPSAAGGRRPTAAAIDDPIGPASGLRVWLREHPAQLVVATTRAHAGLRRAILGSTAAQFVHQSPVPVLLVPPGP